MDIGVFKKGKNMTENEAIRKIQWRIETATEIAGKGKDGKAFEDLEAAIKALEEIQQYRKIGTVESLKNLPTICDSLAESYMKAEKLIEELKAYREIGTVEGYELAINASIDKHNLMIVYKDRLKEYEKIGTVEEFKTLKEKSVAKELAEHNFQDEVHHYLCPSCRSIVNCNQNYCDECGQALDT